MALKNTMASNSEVYRPAVHADYESVMAINRNVYGGLDYLQAKFHVYVLDPLRYPFVVEYNGEVVGYKCGYVIDDGLSIVSEAARVRADLQRKGFFRKLDEAVLKAARVKFPYLQRTIWTSTDLDITLTAIQKYKGIIELVARRPRVCFDSNCDDLQALCSGATFQRLFAQFGSDRIAAVPRRLAINVLTDGINFQAAVPEGMLIVNFEPWGLHHRSTYVEMLKVSTLHVMENEEYRNVSHERNTGSAVRSVRNEKRTNGISCFSFHSVVQSVSGGHRCRVDFYCPPGERATAKAAAHLLYHVRELASCYQNTDVSFGFLIPQHIDKPTLKRILTEELGLHCIMTPESDGFACSWNIGNPQAKL